MSKEIWLPVKGFGGRYWVSSLGRFKSLDMVIVRKNGVVVKKKGRIVKQHFNHSMYLQIAFSMHGKMSMNRSHRVIAKMFIPNPENKPEVNHLNGIRHDNRVENLEWCTPKENTQHAFRTGLVKFPNGDNHHLSKLTFEKAKEIRRRIKNGETGKELSSIYNVSESIISQIKTNKRWI